MEFLVTPGPTVIDHRSTLFLPVKFRQILLQRRVRPSCRRTQLSYRKVQSLFHRARFFRGRVCGSSAVECDPPAVRHEPFLPSRRFAFLPSSAVVLFSISPLAAGPSLPITGFRGMVIARLTLQSSYRFFVWNRGLALFLTRTRSKN